MKKAFLYAFAAAVLGVGIMLFPLWTFFRSYGEEGPIVTASAKIDSFEMQLPAIRPMYDSENWQNYTMSLYERGVPTFSGENLKQDDLRPAQTPQIRSTDVSLQMLTIGFIVALVAYIFVRRRFSRPAYLPSVRFPPC